MSESYTHKYQDATSAELYDCGIYAPNSGSSVLWEIEQRLLDGLLHHYCPGHIRAEALDFACGTGRILEYLMCRVRSLVGIDISQAMLDRARTKVGDKVELICANITALPESVPGDKDLITSFRFLLLAEPELRRACVQALTKKLRSTDSVMILNSHGNPWSYRSIASLRNWLLRREKGLLPAFGVGDMRRLARECGLRVEASTGMGFIPGALARILPRRLIVWLEYSLAGRPLIWRFGTNLFFVCRRNS